MWGRKSLRGQTTPRSIPSLVRIVMSDYGYYLPCYIPRHPRSPPCIGSNFLSPFRCSPSQELLLDLDCSIYFLSLSFMTLFFLVIEVSENLLFLVGILRPLYHIMTLETVTTTLTFKHIGKPICQPAIHHLNLYTFGKLGR